MRIPILFVIYESNMQWKKQINNLIGDPIVVVFFFLVGFCFVFVVFCFVLFYKGLYFIGILCVLAFLFSGRAASD